MFKLAHVWISLFSDFLIMTDQINPSICIHYSLQGPSIKHLVTLFVLIQYGLLTAINVIMLELIVNYCGN